MCKMHRRDFIGRLAAGTTAWAATGGKSSPAGPSAISHLQATTATPVTGRSGLPQSGLYEPALRPLPLGSIRPRGWLARQLRIQADGLSGHLDEFWPDVGESQWFGGEAEGWERAPYWLDGVIPLAWLLDDESLKTKVTKYMEEVLARQRPDGWYGPYPEDASVNRYDLWAILLANKVMVQYYDASGDERALQAARASLRALFDGVQRTPLYNWGKYRWYEGLIPAFDVFESSGEPWLLDLARRLREQGTDFSALFSRELITQPTPRRGLWTWDRHVVNTGMAVKAAALSWRLDRAQEDREFPTRMLEVLDRYHGQVNGMFTGDECLSGKNPVQGTELCSVVEFMYSLEILLSIFGDPIFGDRLERVAFNALPATFKPDMWAHQYVQQVNQIQCTINHDHMWSTNGPESNIYGLEPNYGCCTANMHQGWPKFASHLWMRTPYEGIAAVAYAPSEASFESGGVPVTVTLDTEFPFREELQLTVSVASDIEFPLLLRVPAWSEGATLSVEGGSETRLQPGTFQRLSRRWTGTTIVSMRFPMRPKVTARYHDGIAVERGPLVYSLDIEEEWTRVNADVHGRELPHGDFEVRPASAWNYGLLIPEENPESAIHFEERPVGELPFSPDGAGMKATVPGRLLPDWGTAHGWASEFAPGIQESTEPTEELTLIPYGCTNIRITEFPRVRADS